MSRAEGEGHMTTTENEPETDNETGAGSPVDPAVSYTHLTLPTM